MEVTAFFIGNLVRQIEVKCAAAVAAIRGV
jgi:hypothetical protein